MTYGLDNRTYASAIQAVNEEFCNVFTAETAGGKPYRAADYR
jgi:hypothetical protein